MSSSSGSFTHSSVSSFVPISSSRAKNMCTETCTLSVGDTDAPPGDGVRSPAAAPHHNVCGEEAKLHCTTSKENLSSTELHFHNDQLNYFCLPQHVSSDPSSNMVNRNSARDVSLATSSKWVAASNQSMQTGADTVSKSSTLFVPQVLDQCSVAHKKKFHYQRELLQQQQQQKQSVIVQENALQSQTTLSDVNHLRKTDSIQNSVLASQLFPIFEPYSKDDSLAHYSDVNDHVLPNFTAPLPVPTEQSSLSNIQQKSGNPITNFIDPVNNIGNLGSVSKAVDFTNIYGGVENYHIYGKKAFNSPHQDACKLDFLEKSLSSADTLPTTCAPGDSIFASQPYMDLYTQSSYEVCPDPEQFPELSRSLTGGKIMSNAKELLFPSLPSFTDEHSNIIAKKAFGDKHLIDISGHTQSKTRSDFNVNTLINIGPRNDQETDPDTQNVSEEIPVFQSGRFEKDYEASTSRTIPATNIPSPSVSRSSRTSQSKASLFSGTLINVDDPGQYSADESSVKSRVENRGKDDALLPFFPVGALCHSSSEYNDNSYLSSALDYSDKNAQNETELTNDDLNLCLNHLPPYSSSSLTGACDQSLNSTSTSSNNNTMYTSPHPSHNIDSMLNSSSGQSQAVSTSLLSPSVNVPPFHGNPTFYQSSFEDFVQSNLPFYPGLQHFPSSNLNLPAPEIGVPGLHSASGGKLSQVPSYLGHLSTPLSPTSRPMNLASDSSCVYDSPHEPLVSHSVAAPIPLQPLHPAHVLGAPHPFPSCLPTSTSILPYPLLQSHSFHDRPVSAPNVPQKLPSSTYVPNSTVPTHSVSKILHPTTSSPSKSSSSSTLVPHPCLSSASSTINQGVKLSDRTISPNSMPSISSNHTSSLVKSPVKNHVFENASSASLTVNRSGSPLNLPVLDIKVSSKKTRSKVKKEPAACRSKQPAVSKDHFQCNMCSQEFASNKLLQKHKGAEHNSGSSLECNICKTTFRDRMSLREHRAKHCTRRRYVCQFCNKSFGGSSSLAAHKRIHTGDMPYKCDECGRKFRHLATLKSHVLMHSGERPFQCTLCSLRFSQRGTLAKHFKKHASDPKLKCPLCSNLLKDKDGLARHMKMPHFQCDACKKSFCNRKKLDMHVVKDHDLDGRPFKCDLCPSTFAVRLNYTKHKNSIHREADLVCKECGARFKRKDRFNAHQKVHASSSPNSNSSKVHVCQLCNAKFNQRNSLSKHYRALHGVPPNTESLNSKSVDDKTEEVHPNG